MPNDDSNFDTMRLIEGADASGQYSLEEILQEFSDLEVPQHKSAAAPHAIPTVSPEQAPPTPVPPAPDPEPDPLPDVQIFEEDTPSQEAPKEAVEEYQPQSEAEIAAAIAQALANTLDVPESVSEPAPEPAPQKKLQREALADDLIAPATPVEQLVQTQIKAPTQAAPSLESTSDPASDPGKQTPRDIPQPENREKAEKPSSKKKKKRAAAQKPAPDKQKETPAEPENISVQQEEPSAKQPETRSPASESLSPPNPGTTQKKIPKSRVHRSFMESAYAALSQLRTIQRQDIPGNSASLKSAEKHYRFLVQICGVLSPFRYVILTLMVFALAGRRFSWMLLGFLGGATGSTVAIVLTLISLFLSWHSLLQTFVDLAHLRFSYRALLLISTLLSLVDTLLHRSTPSLLPLLVIGWCLEGTADLMICRAKQRSLQSVIAGRTRIGVRVAHDKWKGNSCIGKAPASTSGFVRHLEEPDAWDIGWNIYSLVLLVAILISGAYLTARTSGNYLTICSTLLTAALPVAGVLCCARPRQLIAYVLGSKGAVSGWFGMRILAGKRIALIYDSDLFPSGTIIHKGVRVLGQQSPQLLVSYGTSMVLRADNGLTEPFTKLLRETGGQIFHVSHFQATEGGLLGIIDGVEVAVGTYNFMQLIGATPPKSSSKGDIYIALNRETAGLFAIKYTVRQRAARSFDRLAREYKLTMLAATKNFCVNPAFVEHWFQVEVGQMLCPKVDTRRTMSEPLLLVKGATCGFVMSDGIAPYSRLISGARKSHRTGVGFTILSILLSAGLLVFTVRQITAGTAGTIGPRLLLIQLFLFLLIELASRLSVK